MPSLEPMRGRTSVSGSKERPKRRSYQRGDGATQLRQALRLRVAVVRRVARRVDEGVDDVRRRRQVGVADGEADDVDALRPLRRDLAARSRRRGTAVAVRCVWQTALQRLLPVHLVEPHGVLEAAQRHARPGQRKETPCPPPTAARRPRPGSPRPPPAPRCEPPCSPPSRTGPRPPLSAPPRSARYVPVSAPRLPRCGRRRPSARRWRTPAHASPTRRRP